MDEDQIDRLTEATHSEALAGHDSLRYRGGGALASSTVGTLVVGIPTMMSLVPLWACIG